LSAVHAGAPFADPLHVAALHDLIVLHYVRSYRYRRVHIDAFARARVGLVGQLVRKYPAQLDREALRGTGLSLRARQLVVEGDPERLRGWSPTLTVTAMLQGDAWRLTLIGGFQVDRGGDGLHLVPPTTRVTAGESRSLSFAGVNSLQVSYRRAHVRQISPFSLRP